MKLQILPLTRYGFLFPSNCVVLANHYQWHGTYRGNKVYQDIVFNLKLAPAFWLILACLIDFVGLTKFRIGSMIETKFEEKLDPASAREQEKLAKMKSSEYPLQIYKASKRFPRKANALNNVSFVWENGTSLGIGGPNGSGKSTLLDVILGVFRTSRGAIKTFGKALNVRGFLEAYYLTEDDVLWEELTVENHFKLISILRGINDVNTMFWIETFELVAINPM